nr:hypothetical protein [Ensifer aridi]
MAAELYGTVSCPSGRSICGKDGYRIDFDERAIVEFRHRNDGASQAGSAQALPSDGWFDDACGRTQEIPDGQGQVWIKTRLHRGPSK